MSGLVNLHLPLPATSQRETVKDKPDKQLNMRLHTFLTFSLSVITITLGIFFITLSLTFIEIFPVALSNSQLKMSLRQRCS